MVKKKTTKNKIVEEKKVDQPKIVPMEQSKKVYDVILANLIVLTAVALSAFIPVLSLALPVLVFIYLEVGLYGFIYNKERGADYKYEDLFLSLKKYAKFFCMAVVKIVLIAFWTILLIVPGVVCALNYSFTSLILYESSDLDVKGALLLSKELAYGYRWNIFFYGLLALTSICVAMTLMFLVLLIFDFFLTIPSVAYIVLVTAAAILDLVLLAMPMVELAIVDNFIASKRNKMQTT